MVEQGTNLNDFLMVVPCCGALLFVALVMGGVLLLAQMMKAPASEEGQGGEPLP